MQNKKNPLTYISLFSGAGIGCYGFKQESFECIVTNELLEKRLKIQRYNNKCRYKTGYISGDLRKEDVRIKVFNEVELWRKKHKIIDIDVLTATPPCQGMSVANHKKKNEKSRNSLVVESLRITKEINPKFFIFENVRAFLNTICTDIDGKDKKIKEAIEQNLAENYNILYEIINFKDYGNQSSRTRTLVIGTRKDLWEIIPIDIMPDRKKERTLKEVIGNLPSFKKMGEISSNDIYHNFREYDIKMLDWIKDLKEGQSAFENKNPKKIPHRIINGKMVYNTQKNGDKYSRWYWNRPGPCIHTRNDILASQNTIHPSDNRVFSVRELMIMMSIPNTFKWADIPEKELNNLPYSEKRKFLSSKEMNIRQNIGEAVPTIIFRQIAKKIKKIVESEILTDVDAKKLIEQNKLDNVDKLKRFIKSNVNRYNYQSLSKITEMANAERHKNAAYYTRQDICYTIIKDLPEAENFNEIRILEPSIGVGNFLPLLIKKYNDVKKVIIDVVDIDDNSIDLLKLLLNTIKIPKNIKINYITDDFLLHEFKHRYDIIIGNPPFKKIINTAELLEKYKQNTHNNQTNNIFSFFIEKALKLGDIIALIAPKSLINAPEFNLTREILSRKKIIKIIDYGEKGFKDVKIETISFILKTSSSSKINLNNNVVEVESYHLGRILYQKQGYIISKTYPYWLIYRNKFFDEIGKKTKFDIFKVFRDRQITKRITKSNGKIRVLKSRNIGSNRIVDIKGYDCYIDIKNAKELAISKYLNDNNAVLVPNLTYYPRACFLPNNSIADGSVAILTPKNGSRKIKKTALNYYGTREFEDFYRIARNFGTRSLNIDNNSVYFFGIAK